MVMFRSLMVLLFLVVLSQDVIAQYVGYGTNLSPPTFGHTASIRSSDNDLSANAAAEKYRHKNFVGQLCIQVFGEAQPHTVDPNLYDHVITAVNGCPQRIALHVCYYNSESCIELEVPGNDRKKAILGTLPAVKDFRYQFQERR